MTTLKELELETESCTRCNLYKTRKNVVFGSGNPSANIFLIGQAPGNRNRDLKKGSWEDFKKVILKYRELVDPGHSCQYL